MGFRSRILLFFILFAGILLAIYIGFVMTSQNEFFAALMGGIITLAPLVYFGFVVKPDLKILWDPSDVDTYTPVNTIIQGPSDRTAIFERKHVRVIVRNVGKKVAKVCSGDIRLEKGGRLDNCSSFSAEPKALRWVSALGETETTVNIAPHEGEQCLEVIFSDEPKNATTSAFKTDCGVEKAKAPLVAYASTPSAYENKYYRNQDGFCRGRFNVVLTVNSEMQYRLEKDTN
jgi:hypothetical protein